MTFKSDYINVLQNLLSPSRDVENETTSLLFVHFWLVKLRYVTVQMWYMLICNKFS